MWMPVWPLSGPLRVTSHAHPADTAKGRTSLQVVKAGIEDRRRPTEHQIGYPTVTVISSQYQSVENLCRCHVASRRPSFASQEMHTMASPMPVLPLVASMRVCPGLLPFLLGRFDDTERPAVLHGCGE
jgi:hypothetical protein